jgi:rod shape-determining protein MreD
MRRLLVLAAVVVAGVLLQTTVLGELRLAGVRPDVLVLSVVAVAMASGPVSGAAFGFTAGLVADLLFDLPVGVSALVYTAVGFGVGVARVYNLLLAPFVYPVVRALAERVPAKPAQRW